ncbi:uncharacterized protein PGTG_06221 [Puccinia graminis f. sp. tritici CRL 75-36-700-3]|uniref:Uncharacterized protein n=1 Tax=Puccinia graminis f. sp. tritici (strain CRL 75-36-700-3 / race SCCL) TaxID=418459 RepID=E3K7C9_PUCGT|nr:uncharacterized protein PGTG_06221 [Puccinia graminis f. sp. tritici CRL 75-36-700-3]EFP80265.1 hypothetical protein PGTG_06221 [Puccinia graminis f. sp. tritici CRL 75-36-700-3]
MSTAPSTVKEVGENPSANAVTQPTDRELKSKDEERKMRFYGIIQAFRLGKYPSNAQVDESLTYAINNSPIDDSKLSSDGKQLVQDFRDIIETFRVIVKKKNADELMQNFLFHTKHVDADAHIQKLKGAAGVAPSKDEAKNDGQAAAQHLRTLAKLIYTSSETRKLLKDIGVLARDVVADAAVKVADTTRPSEEALKKVDEAAPANEWVGPDGEKRTAHEKAPSTGLHEKAVDLQQMAGKAQDYLAQGQSELADTANTAQSHAEDAAKKVQSSAESKDHLDDRQQAKETAGEAGQVASDKANVAASVASEKKNRLKEAYGNAIAKIPEEHKEKARQAREDTKVYIQDKFPKERRERFIYRLKKVIVEQQRHRDYQEAIDFFLGLAESYKGHAQGITSHAANKSGDVLNDPTFKEAQREMRTLLERFANGSSMKPIFDAINEIYLAAQNDPELEHWFKTLDKYVRRCLQEPGYVMKESCDQAGREINESGKKFWNHKYANHRQTLFDEIEKFFTSYAEDPLNIRFGQNWKKLTKDLFLNSEGNLKLKTQLWEDITTVILPGLLRHIGYIPIPRIEYTDSQLDLVIENLTLEGQNLLPNSVELEMRNYFKLSAYEKIPNSNRHSFWISFSQVQADLRDVAFYVHKKSGFPKIKDSGMADVVISGNGVSGKVHIESSEAKDRVFVVKDVKIKVDKLAFGIRETKHNFLYSTLKPLAQSLVKKQISKAVEDGIRTGLGQLDAQFVDIRERLEAAEGDDKVSKMDVIKRTFTNKKDESSIVTSDDKSKKGTFKIVAQRESKIIDWASKNSMVEKQALHQETAASSGASWKSDAFTIVRAN